MRRKVPMKKTASLRTLDIATANAYLRELPAVDRIRWAQQTFGDKLYVLTSAGIDSSLILEHIAQTGRSVPVIHIDTGFLPAETLAFKEDLKQLFDLQIHVFGPTRKQIADITAHTLWKTDLAAYSRITKLEPLTKAIRTLKVEALLTAVRADQTDNRSSLEYIGIGNDGELRIRPFIDWSATKVAQYIDNHGLPRNALHDKGFGSVGDLQTTLPGKDRSGRAVMECGLHVTNGNPVKQTVVTNSHA